MLAVFAVTCCPLTSPSKTPGLQPDELSILEEYLPGDSCRRNGILVTVVAVLPPTFTPSGPFEVENGESPDNRYIHDAMFTACVFLQRMRTTPFSEQHQMCFSSHFVIFVLLSQGGGGGWEEKGLTMCATPNHSKKLVSTGNQKMEVPGFQRLRKQSMPLRCKSVEKPPRVALTSLLLLQAGVVGFTTLCWLRSTSGGELQVEGVISQGGYRSSEL